MTNFNLWILSKLHKSQKGTTYFINAPDSLKRENDFSLQYILSSEDLFLLPLRNRLLSIMDNFDLLEWEKFCDQFFHSLALYLLEHESSRIDESFKIILEGFINEKLSSPPVLEEKKGIREKIEKLLSLSSSSNVYESELALKNAQKLLLKYNIDLNDSHEEGIGEKAIFFFKRLTRRTKELVYIIQDFYCVKVIFDSYTDYRDSTVKKCITLIGTKENIRMAHYVWDFLSTAGEESFKLNRSKRKLSYLTGYYEGFYSMLAKNKIVLKEQGLVWVGDAAISEYIENTFGKLRKGIPSSASVDYNDFYSGYEEGRRLTMNLPVDLKDQPALTLNNS